jgi:hypothetical protein
MVFYETIPSGRDSQKTAAEPSAQDCFGDIKIAD